jgi:heme/copper-type cytochrome/quinol oxidase subunit 2
MTKVSKRITTAITAVLMSAIMAVSASAACSHGKYGTRTGEPKYGGTYTHMHNGVECTVTNYVAVITTFCGYCGATINETTGTVSQHHSYNG